MITEFGHLIAFLKHFHRHRTRTAFDVTDIPADLPPPLATLYREFGGLIEPGTHGFPFSRQDSLYGVGRLTWEAGQVWFASENQGCWAAGVELGLPDPEVLIAEDDETPRPSGVPLTHFLTTLCLHEATFSGEYMRYAENELHPTEILNCDLQPLWLGGRYASGEADYNFWATPDGDLLAMKLDAWLVAASNREPFDWAVTRPDLLSDSP